MNNKALIFILLGLLAIYGLSQVFSGNGESSFDPEFIKVDAEQVTKVVIHAKSDNQEEATLTKGEDGWTLSKGGQTYPAAQDAVDNLLSNLKSLKTSFIAAKSADKWAEYELEDGTTSHITAYGGDKVLADFHIGKFTVNQQAQQITSFFRVAGDDNVYAVIGMEGMMLGQGSSSYRDKALLKLEIGEIESLQLEGDAAYQVTKSGSGWLLDNSTPLDTNTVKNFLMNLREMSGEAFVDGFDEVLNNDKLLKTLTIGGSNMPAPVTVRCWVNDGGEKPFVIQSSQYPTSYFASDSTRLFTRVFKPVSEW